MDNTDYRSPENERKYMTYSQFKNFLECEDMALAIINQAYEKPKTQALLQGSYVDAYFSGELEDFKKNNPSIFKKGGELKADFEICNKVIQTIESDQFFREEFFSGDAQRILTGEIAGVPFKGKIDMLYPDKIVDMKCMGSIDKVWSEEEHRYVQFYSFYKYHVQAAIYQELVRQNFGIQLPYFLAVATKESVPAKYAFEFSQDVLDEALEYVKALAPHFQELKEGKAEPKPCGHCDYCKAKHKFTIFDIQQITKENL